MSESVQAHCEANTNTTGLDEEQRYKDLLAYVVSNGISGEIMAVENYSQMVPLIEDTDEKIRTCQQAFDETKHIRQLKHLGDRVGFKTMMWMVEPQWRKIREGFQEAIANQDLTSCYLMQDLMTESLAIVLYRTLIEEGTDDITKQTATNIIKDEYEHLDLGIARIKEMLQKDPDHVHDRLVWSHNKTIPQLFSMISYSCDSLCGELGVECSTLGLDSFKTDMDTIRGKAVETYVETLERCEFDPAVTMPLISKMV